MVRHFPSMPLSRASNSILKVEHIMGAHVAQASKKLSVEDFAHLLDILTEGIGGSGLRVGQRERLIRLGKVMLHDAPQGRFDPISKSFRFTDIVHRHAKSHSELCDTLLQSVRRPRGDLRGFLTSKNAIPGIYCEALFRSSAHYSV